jgi:hypothetical protein
MTVCIDGSCQVKGLRQIAKHLRFLAAANNCADTMAFAGSFCMERRVTGVPADGAYHPVQAENIRGFFEKSRL